MIGLFFAYLQFLGNIIFPLYGRTNSDLFYDWYEKVPVHIPGNLSLPGGFSHGGYVNQYSATGGFPTCFFSANIFYSGE